jgi:hypothetical protein
MFKLISKKILMNWAEMYRKRKKIKVMATFDLGSFDDSKPGP